MSNSCDPMDWSPPGSSVHGISQAKILEWVVISFSRESSWPRDQIQVSCLGRLILYHLSHQGSPSVQNRGKVIRNLFCTVQVASLPLPPTPASHFPQPLGWPHPNYSNWPVFLKLCWEEEQFHICSWRNCSLEVQWHVLIPTVRKQQTQTKRQLPDFQPSVPSLEIKLLISPFPSSNCSVFSFPFTVRIPTLAVKCLHCFQAACFLQKPCMLGSMPTKTRGADWKSTMWATWVRCHLGLVFPDRLLARLWQGQLAESCLLSLPLYLQVQSLIPIRSRKNTSWSTTLTFLSKSLPFQGVCIYFLIGWPWLVCLLFLWTNILTDCSICSFYWSSIGDRGRTDSGVLLFYLWEKNTSE